MMNFSMHVRFALIALLMMVFVTDTALAEEKREMIGDFAKLFAGKQAVGHVNAWRRYAMVGIPLIDQAPTIDGAVGVREWGSSARLNHLLHMAEATKVNDMGVWYLGYTKTDLYIAFQFARPAGARRPTANDFVEILLDANHDHQKFCNLAASLEGKKWDGIAPNLNRGAWSPNWKFAARETSFGWEGEIAVPFADFPNYKQAPEPGTVWGLDLVRNERTPIDRLAHLSWRSRWHSVKDLAHMVFLGKPVAVRVEAIGWDIPRQLMGVELALSNFGDQPIELNALAEIRRASRRMPMSFIKALDSALTEDMDAAIGAQVDKEIATALTPYPLKKMEDQSIVIPAKQTKRVAMLADDEPGEYLASFSLRQGDSLLAGMTVPYKVTVPLAIELRSFLYSAGLVEATVDLRRTQDKLSDDTKIELSVAKRDSDKVLGRMVVGAPSGSETVNGDLKFSFEPDSTYFVTAKLISGGDMIAENRQPLHVPPKADWIHNAVGKSDLIPPPFVPLKVAGRKVKTLTSTLDWSSGSIWPDISVKGKQIFTAPMQLVVEDGDGKRCTVRNVRFEPQKTSPSEVQMQFSADVESIGKLSGKLTVAYDGFTWCNIELTPKGTATVGRVSLETQMHNRFAKLVTNGRMPIGTGYVGRTRDDVGGISPEGRVYPWTFAIWYGSVEAGFQWYAENERNWSNANRKQVIFIKPAETATTLSIHFVDTPTSISKATDWSFGFMPTPARHQMGGAENHAYFQSVGTPTVEKPDESIKAANNQKYRSQKRWYDLVHGGFKQRGVTAVIVFSRWNDMWGYPGIRNPKKMAKLDAFVKKMHEQGIKVLVYAGWGMSTDTPEWELYGTELVNHPLKNSGYSTYWPTPVSLYPDLYVYRLKELIEKHGVDGVYMDSTTGINFSRHPNGMKWVDARGKTRGSFPVRAMRSFTQRIYKVLHGEVISHGIYYNHHSPPVVGGVHNFVDVHCPSEFAQFYDGPMDQKFLDYFIAKNGGVQFGYHAELTNKNWMKNIKKPLNHLNAIAVPADVSFKAISFQSWIDQKSYASMAQPQPAIWAAMKWLDSSDATKIPWWEMQPYATTSPQNDVITTLWLKKGERALLCVSNLSGQDRLITTNLDTQKLGLGTVSLTDAITDEIVPIEGGTFSVTIEPERWRLYRVEPFK